MANTVSEMLAKHPGMTEELARYKLWGGLSPRIVEANRIGDEAISSINKQEQDAYNELIKRLGRTELPAGNTDVTKIIGEVKPESKVRFSGLGKYLEKPASIGSKILSSPITKAAVKLAGPAALLGEALSSPESDPNADKPIGNPLNQEEMMNRESVFKKEAEDKRKDEIKKLYERYLAAAKSDSE